LGTPLLCLLRKCIQVWRQGDLWISTSEEIVCCQLKTPCLSENKNTRKIPQLASCVVCGQVSEIDRYRSVCMFKVTVLVVEILTRDSLKILVEFVYVSARACVRACVCVRVCVWSCLWMCLCVCLCVRVCANTTEIRS